MFRLPLIIGILLLFLTLWFSKEDGNTLLDSNTHSLWNLQGLCVSGNLKGKQLQSIPAYQEFWHSWKQFHPLTIQDK